MTERDDILKAMAALEAQRDVLGNLSVDAALDGLKRKLAALDDQEENRDQASQNTQWTSERKYVTILFADISGFTARSEKMDPEVVRGQINACFKELVPVIYKYGGVVEKFIGDEVMAFFGAPAAHEDDAERCLLAALELMDTLRAFNQMNSFDYSIHIGVNTGLVVAGGIGTPDQQQYGVTGDAVNLASRLANQSKSGQIFVGNDTFRLTSSLFNFQPLKPVTVKGKSNPVPVYQLVSAKRQPGKTRGLKSKGLYSPLVGRELEVETVTTRIHKLMAGEGGIVGIIGEAGIGKSRLIEEVREGILKERQAINWLETYTLSFGQSISYWPFQEILLKWAGISEEDNEEVAWSKLERNARGLFGDQTIDFLPYFASLLSMEVKGEYAQRVTYLDSEGMSKQIVLSMRRFFERLASIKPTVLVFEDLHWMDSSSTILLERLLPLTETVPLLIIGLSRPERGTPAARLQSISSRDHADHYSEVRLNPLDHTNSQRLVQNLVEIEDLPGRIHALITSKAEGNPLFMEEVIRTLIDQGAIKQDSATGRWLATNRIDSISLSDSLHGIIASRVDQLEDPVKEVLRVAAVIGRTFLHRVLQNTSDAEQHLEEYLSVLIELEFIDVNQSGPEFAYTFKHALTQEAIYESILLEKRRELHARVGQAFESLFTDRLEEFYGILAYHFAKGEVWDKAQIYLLEAGDQAVGLAADEEGLKYYAQALAAYEHASGNQLSRLQRAGIERKIGEALLRRGHYHQAIEHIKEALSSLDHTYPTSTGALRKAILHELMTLVIRKKLPSLSPKSQPTGADPVAEEIWILCEVLGWAEAGMFANPERLLWAVLHMLNFSESRGFIPGMAAGSSGFGTALDYIPLYKSAESYHRVAIELANESKNPLMVAQAYQLQGLHSIFIGQWEQALASGRRAQGIFKDLGDLHRMGLAGWIVATALASQGNFFEALEVCKELFDLGTAGEDMQVNAWSLRVSGYVKQRLGRIDESIRDLKTCIELSEKLPDYRGRVYAGSELAECYLRQNNLSLALKELEATKEVMVRTKVRTGVTVTFFNKWAEACIYAAEAESENGGGKKARLEKAGQACKVNRKKQARVFPGGLPEALRYDGLYEWLRGKPESARKWWDRSLVEAERMGMQHEKALTLFEMGKRFGESQYQEKAEIITNKLNSGI